MNTCPKCGASRTQVIGGVTSGACNTTWFGSTSGSGLVVYQSQTCRIRELEAQLAAANSEMESTFVAGYLAAFAKPTSSTREEAAEAFEEWDKNQSRKNPKTPPTIAVM